MNGTIAVERLGKRFTRRRGQRPATLKEGLIRGFRAEPDEQFWGLRDISFTVSPGDAVGIVGRNGAGKSTLLRLIGGVGKPDEGRITTRGRIGALFDLNTDMADDLSGAENLFLSGVVAGLTRAEVTKSFDEIVAFAGLDAFIHSPLRTYSNGMRLRLAFSVAAYLAPDILLVDEVIAVGDAAFQTRCLERIAAIRDQGCTVLIVSHETAPLRFLCPTTIFLRAGRLVAHGPTEETLRTYERSFTTDEYDAVVASDVPDALLRDGTLLRYGINRFGTLEAEITAVRTGAVGGAIKTILPGEPLVLAFDYRLNVAVRGVKAQVKITGEHGEALFEATTENATRMLSLSHLGGTVELNIARIDLATGRYFLTIGLHHMDWQYSYDNHVRAYQFDVSGTSQSIGVIEPPVRWHATPRES